MRVPSARAASSRSYSAQHSDYPVLRWGFCLYFAGHRDGASGLFFASWANAGHSSSIMTTNRCLLSSLLLDIPRRGKRVPQIDGRLRDNRRQHFRSTHDRDVESNSLQSALVRFGSPSDVPTHSLEGLPGRAANGCGANNEFRKEDDADPRFFFLLIESASMRKRPGIESYRVGRNSGWHSRESCSIAQISSCSTRPPQPSTHQPKID